jgi:RND family efflux transporter MFP subunit
MKSVIRLLIFACVMAAMLAGVFVWRARIQTVTVVHPVRGQAVQAVYATGTVEAGTMLPIAPRSPARLMALLADEGQQVSKDQVLAQLENTDLEQQLKSAQAQAAFAGRDYARKKKLGSYYISQQEIDQARAARDAANATVKQIEAQLSYLQLTSPADGTIIKRDGEVGQLIGADQPVFWLACCTPLRVAAEVDEEDISLVHPGEAVLLSADAFPGEIFHGIVHDITPKGDPVARSYRVRITFIETPPLLIGMTAESNIIVRTKDNALMLPRAAVAAGRVWRVEDGVLKHAYVQTGIITPEAIEITAGLSESDEVVAELTDDLKEGTRVKTSPQDWKKKD